MREADKIQRKLIAGSVTKHTLSQANARSIVHSQSKKQTANRRFKQR